MLLTTRPLAHDPACTDDNGCVPVAVSDLKTRLLGDIAHLKQQRNAVILAHVYERLEVQDVADYQGDSLGLSQQAARTLADTIVFCGVHFMAETAKLLSPQKTVYLANPNAGCPMADMITAEQLRAFKAQYPGVPVVAYVNTSAEVKAESDICCTSANAVAVVRSLKAPKVLFVPDRHLGAYVAQQLPDVEVICWQGYCPMHLRLDAGDLMRLKAEHPSAAVLAHPECDEAIRQQADFLGSTTAILQQVQACAPVVDTFIVCTEESILQRLQTDYPHRRFLTPSRVQAICPNMKMTRLENIRKALLGQVQPVTIAPDVAERAKLAIERMLAISAGADPLAQSSAACRCSSIAQAMRKAS